MFPNRNRSVSLPLVLLLAAATATAAETTYFYPSQEGADFSVKAPDNWTATAGEEVGDYFGLDGPTGVVLQFRTVEGSEKGMEAAVKESLEFFNEVYKDVKLGDPEDHKVGDAEGFYAVGTGKDKESGDPYVFGIAWYALGTGNIAEIYFAASADDDEGIKAAEKVLDTFDPK